MLEDFPTRFPVWLALMMYALTVGCWSRRKMEWAKWCWTVGCLSFLVHVIAAFQLHYQWSHEVAVKQTKNQTEAVTGVSSGFGIYVNYLFTLIWVADAVAWWALGSERYANRSGWLAALIHGFFVFMIFNGAVVFASGTARWIGLVTLGLAAVTWWTRKVPETAEES